MPEFAHLPKHPFLHEPAESMPKLDSSRPSFAPSRSILATPPTTSTESLQPAPTRVTSSGKFQFWYIGKRIALLIAWLMLDSSGIRVEVSNMAMVRLDPDDYTPLRKIEFLDAQKDHAFVASLRMSDSASTWRYGQMTRFAFVQDDLAPPKCSKFESDAAGPSSNVAKVQPSRAVSHFPTPVSDDDDWVALPAKNTVTNRTISKQSMMIPLEKEEVVSTTMVIDATMKRVKSGSVMRDDTPLRIYSDPTRRPAPRLSSHVQPIHPLAGPSTIIDPATLPDFDPSKAITFDAGSYEIVLILDTREIESRNNRDRFAEKLAEKGVKIETRALRLGDVCWVARRTDGLGGEEDECVLDYVLERKRLDDLCSSMRDGRYHEQCVSETLANGYRMCHAD